ncbi:MFS transporter [Sulfurovum sp. bin170]|uniref:MFS transporter n=1 Tax=Sulfurovum sp. bin170 TaxID=2695268 RepID=UPI0013DFE970|nr:MFS transporter [Sulfurovum sp. bin170]NEW61205.1 MFS transporter [Sulfurovum sp. bin170]
MFKIDDPKNNYKNITHAFFLALAITIAEPSTVLPLMVHHFSDSVIVVGIFASLLRGGAIMVQLYAAFHAQAYRRVLPYLQKVFFFRFISWFMIGLSIYFFGEHHKTLTLWLIGIGLFFFSFSAGFGAIYFKELQAKLFSKKYRGKTMANRSIAGSIASIISGGVAGFVLQNFEAPMSYAYLFMVSSLFMVIGFATFVTIEEPSKENISTKEKDFRLFIKNAIKLLKQDKRLQQQILIIFLGFSYLLSMPFVILNANSSFTLTGWALGGFITIQMLGSIIGSTLLWRKLHNYENMLSLSFFFMILAFMVALFANNIYLYGIVFLLFGIAIDGFSISGMNLVIEIAPEDKRPVYTALQVNITSFGLFFPILGGLILKFVGSYTVIYLLTIVLLLVGFILSIRMDRDSYKII